MYTFTDISAGYLPAAKERFKDWPNMEFVTLDICKDPLTQGFQPESYDLIIASNVLHATPNLHDTLSNVHKLLHQDGRLLLEELCCDVKSVNFVMGVLPGWWLGCDDGRENEPYVFPDRWDKEFKNSGFQGLDEVILDGERPTQLNALMVAKPLRRQDTKKAVTILRDEKSESFAADLKQRLSSDGIDVTLCDLQSTAPADRDILSVIDIHQPFFYNITPVKLHALQAFLSKVGNSGIFWLTRSSQVHCHDPRFAQTIGAIRAIRSELLIDFATCEIDDIDNSNEIILRVFRKFLDRSLKDSLSPEYEYVISKGVANIGRFYPFVMKDELIRLDRAEKQNPVLDLTIGKYGRLRTLEWTAQSARALIDDEVEIDVAAVGMNFKVCIYSVVVYGHSLIPTYRTFSSLWASLVQRRLVLDPLVMKEPVLFAKSALV